MTSRPTVPDPFGARATLRAGGTDYDYHRLGAVADRLDLDSLPVTIKILLENLLRHAGAGVVREEDVETLLAWRPGSAAEAEIPFMPARVLLQDFTGVPAVVDLAVMRDAMADLGGDPSRVNPLVPADLVIDHSVQIDRFGTPGSFAFNVEREYDRNGERYQLLRWAQTAFRDLRVVPPGTGIVHQVNLEFLATVIVDRPGPAGGRLAFPDTVVGTDSHTTMVNGLGVLGYGVGGIEAEAVLLGQPLYQPMPHVVGVRLHGALPRGSTATDLVLVVTELLRAHGVVGSFVEFAGDGLATLALADRATISNMSPEFGATSTLFPIDDETLSYLRLTGRSPERVDLVERYARTQGLWREPGDGPTFDELLELDLGEHRAVRGGPAPAAGSRPADRPARQLPDELPARARWPDRHPAGRCPGARRRRGRGCLGRLVPGLGPDVVRGRRSRRHAAGRPDRGRRAAGRRRRLPADRGRGRRPGRDHPDRLGRDRRDHLVHEHVQPDRDGRCRPAGPERGRARAAGRARGQDLAGPRSRAVTGYLEAAGLMDPLETLGFALAGYGCTTCIGNSGPLDDAVAAAVEANDLVVAAVLSGNRNFEGRIHPLARASYLASPPLVVAFALAGRVDIDLTTEPLGTGSDGRPVFLADIWPEPDEIRSVIADAIDPDLFIRTYATVFEGDDRWRALPIPAGDRYVWETDSTYIAKPPFFDGLAFEPRPVADILDARVLAVLGDSVTTDHISPAGSIAPWSPAGQWLQAHGVGPLEFNSYGARRGHHEVMARGTFANIRLRNRLVDDKEGPYTVHLPDGDEGFIYDIAMRYAAEGTPLGILAGREYGSGSSRDWAAKGPALLGVRFVIAESFERIHRSNLVGMGILPLQFKPGETAASLGLSGRETLSVVGLERGLTPRQTVTVLARSDAGTERRFGVIARLDGPIDVEYYHGGGILPTVLRRLAGDSATA